MIISIILFLISFILESFITNIFRGFIPFFIIGFIIIFSMFDLDDRKKYIFIFIVGIIYDLLYTDLIIIHGFIYYVLLFLATIILNSDKSFFKMVFTYYIEVAIYSIIMLFYSFISTNINILNIILKIIKSMFLNTIYFVIIYTIFIGIFCLIKNIRKNKTY